MVQATTFFSDSDRQRIEAAVQAAEGRTSGEIVPLVVDQSYDYPRTELIGAGCFSLATSLLLSWALGDSSIWVFLPAYLVSFFLFKLLINKSPTIKRRLTHPAEIDAEVEEMAFVSFLQHGLHNTRDRTGILILISLLERRVYVLADQGINDKVPSDTWDSIVKEVVAGIKGGHATDALCSAIGRCGALLEKDFPRREDDTNELPNMIVD